MEERSPVPSVTVWLLGILGAATAALLVAFATNLMGKVSNTELTTVRMEGEIKALNSTLGGWTGRVEKLERSYDVLDKRLDDFERDEALRRRAYQRGEIKP